MIMMRATTQTSVKRALSNERASTLELERVLGPELEDVQAVSLTT